MLTKLLLQNFRCYDLFTVEFGEEITAIVGPNASGKTSFTEAIFLCLTGKSFRAEKAQEMISFGKDMGRSKIAWREDGREKTVEVLLAQGGVSGTRGQKKIFVDGVPRSQAALIGLQPVVFFRPEELDIITDGPSLRREFLDVTLESVHREYYHARREYERSLRQRNALLHLAKETGVKKPDEFAYWDHLLITSGQTITHYRRDLLDRFNASRDELLDIYCTYDASEISQARLAQYAREEVAAGITLVGPQRDDFILFMGDREKAQANMHHYASRGQQRIALLQLKMHQKKYVEEQLGKSAIILLDDIFSELDERYIELVLNKISNAQIILTTTHEEFLSQTTKSIQKVSLF